MKLREGYEQVNPQDIREVHINDKIIAVRCEHYMLMHRDVDGMFGAPSPDDAFFGGQWLRLPLRDKQAGDACMSNLMMLVTKHRDSLMMAGKPEYQVSALIGMKVVDIGRTSPQKFRETFDTGINFGVSIGKSGEHNADNQSTK